VNRIAWRLVAALAFGSVALAAADTRAGSVKEANATCMTATAVLLVSDGADDAKAWQPIRDVVKSNSKWTLIPTPEPNVTDKVALTKWSIKHTYKGGPTTAYTAQCGHGGTCNEVAHRFLDKFPQMTPAPEVFCGEISNVLENPTPAGG